MDLFLYVVLSSERTFIGHKIKLWTVFHFLQKKCLDKANIVTITALRGDGSRLRISSDLSFFSRFIIPICSFHKFRVTMRKHIA